MRKSTFRRIASVLGLTGLVGAALTGCALIHDVAKSSQNAWAPTYEISVDSKLPTTLSGIAYFDTPS